MSANYAEATIVWGANSMTLLELMKTQTGVCDGDDSQDIALSLYLQIAGEAAENYCDNVLASQDTTEQHPVKFSPVALRYYPVTALNAVTIDGDDMTTDYEVFDSEGVDYLTSSRTGSTSENSFKQMNIAYTAGYDPLPADLGSAIVVAASSYETGTGATGEVKRESVVGVGSIEYSVAADDGNSSGFLSSNVTGVLDKYSRRYL
jgi:hypothetical protein